MDVKEHIAEILTLVSQGELDVKKGGERLRDFPSALLEHSTLDLHRSLRTGMPEVIYGAGKTPQQILEITERLAKARNVLATRISPEAAQLVLDHFPDAVHDPLGRTVTLVRNAITALEGEIVILTAGTSDLPVALEAKTTCAMLGGNARVISDVGVAGIHRLFAHLEELRSAAALIVVAGMEGALASVVGGLVAQPVIAVPTSVGYGAHLGGVTPLLGMLTSCASGVTVVNIDNGFGAACAAMKVVKMIALHQPETSGEKEK